VFQPTPFPESSFDGGTRTLRKRPHVLIAEESSEIEVETGEDDGDDVDDVLSPKETSYPRKQSPQNKRINKGGQKIPTSFIKRKEDGGNKGVKERVKRG
jgi:hypothetical protein